MKNSNITALLDSLSMTIANDLDLNIQNIIDAFPSYILIVDENHHIFAANKAVVKYLRLKTKNIIGKYCYKVVHNINKPIKECPVEEAVASGRRIEREIFDDTHKKWFMSVAYPIKPKTNTSLKFFLHMIIDINEKETAQEELKKSNIKLQQVFYETIEAFSGMIEVRDPYTSGHQKKVADLAVLIGNEIGLDIKKIESIKIAALVHDIGKIYVPESVLSKPRRLTNLEFDMIKTHTKVGYDILKKIKFQSNVAKIVYQHHERLNGSGYPTGAKGKDVLFESKILAVADVVEAMLSYRPYRPAFDTDKVLEQIENNKGILYDIKIVDACAIILKNNKFKVS
ncbi:MAG: HD-GYP domain-containing protein [Actinobacteria bacterium]|nr:HD-GYP domain-containing protein [Actinomycetota bacterium]